MSDNEDDDEMVVKLQLNMKKLSKILQMAKTLSDEVFGTNCFWERSIKFRRELDGVMTPYKELYKDLQKNAKQATITSFFCLVQSTATTTSSSSPSTTAYLAFFVDNLPKESSSSSYHCHH